MQAAAIRVMLEAQSNVWCPFGLVFFKVRAIHFYIEIHFKNAVRVRVCQSKWSFMGIFIVLS